MNLELQERERELKERDGVEKQLAAVKNELTACQKELKERDEKISGWWHLHVPRAWRPHSAAHPGPTRNRGGAWGCRGGAGRSGGGTGRGDESGLGEQ